MRRANAGLVAWVVLGSAAGCGSTTLGPGADAGTNAMDVSIADAGNACAMLPQAAVSTSPGVATGGGGFAFDGRGHVAVIRGNEIDLFSANGSHTLLSNTLPNVPIALAYTLTGDLVFVGATAIDGGVAVSGSLAVLSAGSTVPRVVVPSVNGPFGLAVDAHGDAWFSDISTVRRVAIASSGATPDVVSRDVPGPTLLALDPTGASLYVASLVMGTPGAIYQVPLSYGADGASVSAAPAVLYASGVTLADSYVLGLAVDGCGDVYALDELGMTISRIAPTSPRTPFPIVTNLQGSPAGGLAFGQGGSFNNRALYTTGGLGAMGAGLVSATVGAPGVPLPAP